MKRILGDALVAMLPARGIDAIERQIVLAATHHPVKLKTSGEQTAEAMTWTRDLEAARRRPPADRRAKRLEITLDAGGSPSAHAHAARSWAGRVGRRPRGRAGVDVGQVAAESVGAGERCAWGAGVVGGVGRWVVGMVREQKRRPA